MSLEVLGRSWGAPVWHVTAAPACYSRPGMLQDPLQLCILAGKCVARCSRFVLASDVLASELVAIDLLSFHGR